MLAVHSAATCDSSERRVRPCADLPVGPHDIYSFQLTADFIGGSQGLASEPVEREEKQTFMLRTKARRGM